jgi:pyruvate-ferredoxin/flavodoxin oxidoreductase
MEEEQRAVASGYWQLYRFNPTIPQPFTLDSKAPTLPFKEFLEGENRFASLKRSNPAVAETLFTQAEEESKKRFAFYQKLSTLFE